MVLAVDGGATGAMIVGAISAAVGSMTGSLTGITTAISAGLSTAVTGAATSVATSMQGTSATWMQKTTADKVKDTIKDTKRYQTSQMQRSSDLARDQRRYQVSQSQRRRDLMTARFRYKKYQLQQALNKGDKLKKFLKTLAIIARFWPIIKICIAIIIICSNLLFYVIMIIAWIAAAILEVVYFIFTFPPFFDIIWFVYFVITDFIPFLLYAAFLGVLLGIISIGCGILAFINICSHGKLKFLVLCQNNPASWYKTPNWHLDNRYIRSLFCSKPCRKGYVPEETGLNCIRQPKETPFHCPQAQIMRFYAGDGKKDRSRWFYQEKRTKGNMKYLSKPPEAREDELLVHFINMTKYMQECTNKESNFSMNKYIPLVRNVCANSDALYDLSFSKMDQKQIGKLQKVCQQSFCNSEETYPFCSRPTVSTDDPTADLIKKIILFIIALICFVLVMMFMFAYINEGAKVN